ncbi:MAG: RNA polymerase factor sigma-54 [Bacteroidaceae bacterium]|nr:RNA polymerase factor sigma-54 [Bacteroidaceae bacterium]
MSDSSYSQIQQQQQTLSQSLSPQQLLAVQLLEMTTVEIEERVRGEVMDNPALDAVEPDEAAPQQGEAVDVDVLYSSDAEDDYSGNDDIPVASGGYVPSMEAVYSDTVSFGETLLEQLGSLTLSPDEMLIGEYIIGTLDEDGLLRKSLSEIEDELLIYNNISTNEQQLLSVLKAIQTFEPAGVAARDLKECLLLQLQRNASGKDFSLHKRILDECYDDFAGKRWGAIPEKLCVADDECRDAIADIVRLNPRPGASFAEGLGVSRQQVMPDFLLDIADDKVYVSLNNAHIPSLRVNDDFVQMLDRQDVGNNAEHRAATLFLKQKIEAAKGFIGAVQQREMTMLSTMRAIASVQKEYFLSGGDEALLKPMILEDVAKMTGADISTVSRVCNSKYVQTPWSVTPLKYYFSDGVTMSDGTTQSVYELFRVIKELVDNEDKYNPLTDQALQEQLAAQGYDIARRTVAKYREQLHIPVARLRKE